MTAATIEWSSFLHLTNSLCFSSARCHCKGITQSSSSVEQSLCPGWTQE